MALDVTKLYGVTPDVADRLRGAGLKDSDALLDAVAQPANHKALAAKLGIDERALLELGNRADLARIKGSRNHRPNLIHHKFAERIPPWIS